MDRLGDFISGLQTLLDSPNPPRDDLIRVIQATHRDFVSSALALSTMTWPTRTHLELVKIIIGLPIPEPSHEVVMADPTTSHEADPFFAADYFDKLRHQLLSTPVSTLADSDGSWVRNIGFSIEATIMQASRRADALERLDEMTKAEEARGRHDLANMRVYCAYVLGMGTLATPHWESIARMVFTMFYLLPFSTKTISTMSASPSEQFLHPHMAKLVVHYSTWLQIVQQIVENHGPLMCRRMPSVIADPATNQFKWGVPTLHLVATTELLRNILMRRLLLPHSQSYPGQAAASAATWASSASTVGAEEQRLERFELTILGKIIEQNASAVYGMMTEQHRLLQVHEEYAKNYEHLPIIPGTAECLGFSLTRTCHGLAPILSYEEQALMQAMEMNRLLECMRDMKAATVNFCYGPLYGCYPPETNLIPAYAELLLLRMATTLYNLDQPWGDIASMLSPSRVTGISQELAERMVHVLRVSSAQFEFFSLNTTEPEPNSTAESFELNTIIGRLMSRPFINQPWSDAHLQARPNDIDSTLADLGFEKVVDLSIEWVREFVKFGQSFMAPQLLYTQIAATIERAFALFVYAGRTALLVDALSRLSHSQWAALADIRFKGLTQGSANDSSSSNESSALSIVFSIAQRLTSMKQLQDSISDLLGSSRWQTTIALCHPEAHFLAYTVMSRCVVPARELVQVDKDGLFSVTLNQRGIAALRVLEKTVTMDGGSSWTTGQFLFLPPVYTETDGKTAELFARLQLSGALKVLSTGDLAHYAGKLGVSEPSLEFSSQDMRLVAHFVQYYAENAPDLLPLLSGTLLAAPANTAKTTVGAQAKANPFSTPNILSRVPLIEAPSSPATCNIAATIREWRRQASQLPFAESRRYIQDLAATCYPSNFQHYLELVFVRFMEAEPIVGVELVIGSISDYMWTSQMVYSRQPSLFHEIRNMFSPVSSKPPVLPEKRSCVDDKAKELAQSGNEPVFNAIVGGKVRPSTMASHTSKLPAIEKRDDRAHHPADNVAKESDTVRSPVACGRILLLLTALRYGRSMGNTPLHMWLTDCLDHAPIPVLRSYFNSLLIERPPTFNSCLPVELDWKKKSTAFVSLWAGDRQLRSRAIGRTLTESMMRYILHNGGEQWSVRWAESSPVVNETVCGEFTRLRTTPVQAEIVKAMLLVPPKGPAMGAESHPLFKLASLLDACPDYNQLAFADTKDWFFIHVLPHIVESLADNEIARTILGQMLSSVDSLYRVIPWLDVGTLLIRSIRHTHGYTVALGPEAAKKHFVAYLSPLARILLAIASYVEGIGHDIVDEDHDANMTDTDDGPTVGSPAAQEVSLDSNQDGGGDVAEKFNWQWLDELLVVYLNGSSIDPTHHSDTIDALLDVYTSSSARSLRQSIENVVVANCLHSPSTALVILKRVFSSRPLDIYSLHTLRPRSLSRMPSIAGVADDTESKFRPSFELYPLAKLVLQSVLGDSDQDRTAKVALLIAECFWAMAEKPDVRRQPIARLPPLIPKDQRLTTLAAGVSFDTIMHVTSGAVHAPEEPAASAAAYALDRSMQLLTLLLVNSDDKISTTQLATELAQSRILLDTILTYTGPSMLPFSALPISLKLLAVLWAAVDNGEAMVGSVNAAQLWSGINFNKLALRLDSHAPKEYMLWPYVQCTYVPPE
ncbi:hypothetical protein GGI19_002970 [Coemansia pectinata]|uniref:Uncharacterized protein n=1 Tax=Coemansia pectinata TaxID=1052879 RepID=A0A9W8L9T5_9FUNG|nr:hypothetical protein GGI19_002970 [Coemansia pectinata]